MSVLRLLVVTGALVVILRSHTVTSRRINKREVSPKECDGDCRPKTTYVSWDSLREYLNEYHGTVFPPHIVGPPLPVKRCRAELSHCTVHNRYCGVVNDHTSQHTLCLTNEAHGAKIALTLQFQEDSQCECMEWRDYYVLKDKRLGRVPLILDVNAVYFAQCNVTCPSPSTASCEA